MSARAIWKYVLDKGPTIVLMPAHAGVLAVQPQLVAERRSLQVEKITIWCIVDPLNPLVKRKFMTVPTGYDGHITGSYLGTVQMKNGTDVWHAFDLGEMQ